VKKVILDKKSNECIKTIQQVYKEYYKDNRDIYTKQTVIKQNITQLNIIQSNIF
jgi:hypothetical protein